MSDPAPTADEMAVFRRALVELRKLRAEVETLKAARAEPVAVVGLGCRFPGRGEGPTAFWESLLAGTDGIIDVPPDRWDADAWYDADPGAANRMYVRRGGFLPSVDGFDASFFGISPREAAGMDPQQRLLLETTWEALEHAGIPGDGLAGSPVGVYLGIMGNDYNQVVDLADAHAVTGATYSVAAGRLSFLLGLTGPCLAIETACSSSLVAIHLAVRSLRDRECDLALAAGVNLILSPWPTAVMCRARLLSPTALCKTFDADADGYVRGEGCGVAVLKRLADAVRDGDRVLAVVRGSAVNQDGRSASLTAPSGPAQETVIRKALADAGIPPTRVSYVEAHGTGTALGDPIEVHALQRALGEGRRADQSLIVGSVKTNVGHLEGAAGIAGFVKAVLALHHGVIPPHLHLKRLNPSITPAAFPLVIPSNPTPWPTVEGTRIAGVSSFGYSGTNVHVVLEQAPTLPATPTSASGPTGLLCLSAKSAPALREVAARFATYLDTSGERWPDVCFTAAAGRSHFRHRLAIHAPDAVSATAQLRAFANGGAAGLKPVAIDEDHPPKVGLVLTGHVRDQTALPAAFEAHPAYRRALTECARAAGVEPAALLSPSVGPVARFAIAYGLVELLRSWGVEPHALTGEGEGWFAAGCVAGVFRAEDAVRFLKGRGAIPLADARIRLFHPVTGAALVGSTARDSACWANVPTGGATQPTAPLRATCDIALSLDGLPTTGALATLYLGGVNLKWAEVFRGSGCRRVGLPTYPFQRKRHWLANARSFHLPPDLAARADAKCALGSPGERFTTEEAAKRLGVVERHRRLLGRLLEILTEEGDATRDERGWVLRATPRGEVPETVLAEVTARYPACGAEIGLLGRCGPRLLDVLRGKLDPLPLLFPPTDATRTGAGQVYAESPFARRMNALAAEAAAWAAGRPGARVLEVGAGTGGTTAAILPRLTGAAEYRFTDVSAGFLPAASRRFGSYGFVSFGVFDFDADPAPTTFVPGSFDLIIAAHAAHAAERLVPALARLRKLLAPGGTLVLVEGGDKERGLDLTFGLTGGWWAFEDTDVRSDYPLVSHDRWPQLLRDAGFADAATLPEGNLVVACADPRAELGSLMSALRERASELASELGIDRYSLLKTDLERLSLAYIRRALFAPPEDAPAPTAADWLYDVAWREVPIPSVVTQFATGDWLILADRGGVGLQVAAKLEALGGRVRLVFPSQAGEPLPTLNAGVCRGVVVLWALDAETDLPLVGETLASLLRGGSQARIRVVTRGAVPVSGGVDERGATQSGVWGLGRVAALEHPERWGGLIDLDPTDAAPADTLTAELLRVGGEHQVAIRDGRRFVPRLVRTAPPPRTPLRCRPDATYLITGGLGTLGREVARRLVDCGARNLLLLGRGGADRPTRVAFIRELEGRDVRVRAVAVDVADRDGMARLLTEVRSEAPLAGVVHAAGVTAAVALADATRSDFEAAMRPKLDGARLLDELTREDPLDFFVLFSSAAAVWGSAGTAPYAAANAALDGLAHARRAAGRPALSVNWARFADRGMVSEEAAAGFDRIGLGGLPLGAALDLLEDVIAAGVTQRTVAAVDWSVFRPVYAGRTQSSFLDEVEARADAGPAEIARPGPLGERLLTAPQAQRHGVLTDYLLTQLRDILGLDESDAIDPADGFFKMGLDSFAVLELRRRLEVALGRPVSATAVFEHPTAASLASFLLAGDAPPPPPPPATNGRGDDLLDLIAGLSASEVESRLEARVPRKKEHP